MILQSRESLVRLHIKAENTEEAAEAMRERGIVAFPGSVRMVPSGRGAVAETAGRFIQDVMRWFGEDSPGDCQPGQGYPSGSLLLFTEHPYDPASLSIVEFDGDCFGPFPNRERAEQWMTDHGIGDKARIRTLTPQAV